MLQLIKKSKEFEILAKAIEAKKAAVALFSLTPAARAMYIAALSGEKRDIMVVTSGEAEATRLCADIKFFGVNCVVFPARDFVFHGVVGQSREYEYRRLKALGELVSGRATVVVVPVEAAMQYTVPETDFLEMTHTIKTGDNISLIDLKTMLIKSGYSKRDNVEGPGQYAVRGGIVDLFAPDMKNPVRIEFWGDNIEQMASFDVESQRRDQAVKKIYLSPSKEVVFDSCEDAIEKITTFVNGAKAEHRTALQAAVQQELEQLQDGIMPQSMDKFYAARYKKPASILDYLRSPLVFYDEQAASKEAANDVSYRNDTQRESLCEQGSFSFALGSFYLSYSELLKSFLQYPTIFAESFARSISDAPLTASINAVAHLLPPWQGDISQLLDDVRDYRKSGYRIFILVGTKRAAASLQKDFESEGIFAGEDADISIKIGHLSAGFDLAVQKIAVISGRKLANEEQKPTKKRSGFTSLSEVKQGDFVVHQNHGIGRYLCIEKMDLQGVVKDYIKLEYDKEHFLYIPVTQLDLLSSYKSEGDGEHIKLSKLGSADWGKAKSRVKKATEEMARELIELYAKRQQTSGISFNPDSDWQGDFEERFSYEETDDQLRATSEIKEDMQSPRLMDRILCGDVGVGKTEVALRAAFKAIMSGYQVAVLVPTTILAFQHFGTITQRMESFPIKVAMLSRFNSTKQNSENIKGLANGTIDLVVGTHKLIQKNIKFKSLGLLIIDEEQRFGVKHKEKLKEMFTGVDVLTLSATPIPRTLNMAMSGIRDLSTIDQPPFERHPIETYVLEYSEQIIEQAIKRELGRGGQVYYIHNRINTIDHCVSRLAKMAPNAVIAYAHGQMDEKELSAVWQGLLDGNVDILVSTTIIETGVDVRNCNTLIIENADHMGLSQLYQLRGRVGRSGRKAYAYFTFHKDKVISEVAAKRLSAIREFTSFGSGIRIAMRDLQIRGAGNLLGESQHGHMSAIGYELYMKLLNTAVSVLKGEPRPADKSDCLIDIRVDAYIPEKYIEDIPSRLEAYKKIAAIESEQDKTELLEELQDRYGTPPASVNGLLDVSLARVRAAQLGIYEINQKGQYIYCYCDSFTSERLRPAFYAMGREVAYNASSKPYLQIKVEKNNTAIEKLTTTLSLIKNAE